MLLTWPINMASYIVGHGPKIAHVLTIITTSKYLTKSKQANLHYIFMNICTDIVVSLSQMSLCVLRIYDVFEE